jgi:hypothetical protein
MAFQHVLASTIDRKIVLVGDVCYRPPITLDFMICMQATLERPWVR